jgi:hypothetical protein
MKRFIGSRCPAHTYTRIRRNSEPESFGSDAVRIQSVENLEDASLKLELQAVQEPHFPLSSDIPGVSGIV